MSARALDRQKLSRITCAVPAALAPAVAEALGGLALPEVFVQNGKCLGLREGGGFLGLSSSLLLEGSRTEIFRFSAPRRHEAAVCRRILEAADLLVPGRGTLFAEDAEALRGEALPFDEARLEALPAVGEGDHRDYVVLCCIVKRGLADPLARSLLEMGLCAPLVSFGKGMGLRNKLGLLRVTIPVDKEVCYFVVPAADAGLVADIAVRKARLDLPGQGFIYRYRVRARAVNARILRGGRRHVASMEQVIEALDELRGSTEWRRIAASSHRSPPRAQSGGPRLVCVSVVCEEGLVADYVRAAMDAGAGGATLVRLSHRGSASASGALSHARETCDLIVEEGAAEAIIGAMADRGLFDEGLGGLAEVTRVERALTYAGQRTMSGEDSA